MPVNPSPEQIAAIAGIAGSDRDGPLVMLNLNKYRERAAYDGDPPGAASPDVSGRDAYNRYGEVALRVLASIGGEVIWDARATMTVIGEGRDTYDDVIAVRYPSAEAFLALAMNAEIGVALAHRDAGLERAVLIRCEDDGSLSGSGAPAA
jgi:uncharacterized protein (DUF1330 family)